MQTDALQLFGSPVYVSADERFALLPERVFQLVALLAANGAWHSRERVATMFWPDLNSAAARRNLRHLLFKAAPGWPALETQPGAMRLALRVDVREFEAASDARDFARAVALYRGPFAAGLELNAPAPFAEWLRFERSRLGAMFRAAAAQRMTQLPEATDREELARHWLSMEPLDEDALLALIEAVSASGRAFEAQRIAVDYTHRLHKQLGIEPSARVRAFTATTAITATTDAARPAVVMPPRAGTDGSATAERGFVGRRAEMLQLQSLLARDECRVLTITGPGGIGKSRLARVALAQLSPRYDASAWIALEDLTGVAQIAPRIAAGLGMTLGGQGDPLAQVIELLRPRRVLLVTDNSEHLSEFAAQCARLVDACPLLKILHTSRARLAIEGEWLLPLAGLPVPEADESDAEILRRFDAVKLFEQRARAVQPAFEENAHAASVAALVREVEGAPLAIELAATWVRMLPVEDIRREIVRSLDLLETQQTGADRQRSVRASFEHSWRLLSPIEQVSLGRLSVFVGPFTQAASAQVALAPLAVLASLVDKSLLRSDGDGRFGFHPLVRQNARERSGDTDATFGRYVDYHVQLLDHFGDLSHKAGKQTIDAIDAALEDLRAVWAAVTSGRDGPAVEKMAGPLLRFFEIKGRWTEGIALFADALARLDAAAPAQRGAVAAVSRAIAALHYRKGEPETAEAIARRALKLYRTLNQPTGARLSLQIIGLSLWQRGAIEKAQRYFEQGLRLAERAGDEAGMAAPLNGIAMCEKSRGRYDPARALYERALNQYRRMGGAQGLAITLNNLANVLRLQRDFEGARRYFAEGLALCDQHGLASVRIFFLINLGYIDVESNRLDAAQAQFEQALRADTAAGEGQSSAEIRLGLGRIAVLRGRFDEGERWLREGIARARAIADVPIQIAAVLCFGELAARRGALSRAAELWAYVAGHPLAEQGDRDDAHRWLAALDLPASVKADAARVAGTLQLEGLLVELAPA